MTRYLENVARAARAQSLIADTARNLAEIVELWEASTSAAPASARDEVDHLFGIGAFPFHADLAEIAVATAWWRDIVEGQVQAARANVSEETAGPADHTHQCRDCRAEIQCWAPEDQCAWGGGSEDCSDHA